jgi:cbb3-type cytochrome oxidase subunit 3
MSAKKRATWASEQRFAWWVISFLIMGSLIFLMQRFLTTELDHTIEQFLTAFIYIGFIGGFWWLAKRKKKHADEADTDEREQVISQKATLFGAAAAFVGVHIFCIIATIYFKQQQKEVVPIGMLGQLCVVSLVAWVGVRSIVILILHGRQSMAIAEGEMS